MELATALIIFAKLPRAGQVKTRLGASIGMEKAAEIYDGIARRTFDMAAQLGDLGVQLWVFFPPDSPDSPDSPDTAVRAWAGLDARYCRQSGHDLGMRMMRAFDTVFADSARQAVIVGSDVPDLSRRILDRAFDGLRTADIVIGPSLDGGYYLLGMSSPTKSVFDDIPWSTDRVLQATLSRTSTSGLTTTLLEPLVDIDTLDDYRAWKGKSKIDPH